MHSTVRLHQRLSSTPRTTFSPRALAALVSAALCAGCGTFPNATPRPQVSYDSAQGRHIYKVGTATIEQATNTTMLPLELSFDSVRNQLVAMHTAYSQQRQDLRVTGDFWRNAQFLGVLATTWGIAAEKTKLRNAGAAAAGLSTVFSDQYALATQARNYAVAATAIECVYNQVNRLDPDLLAGAFNKGNMQLGRSDFVHAYSGDMRAGVVHDALADLFPAIHRTVLRIDDKLQTMQASVLPAMISPAEIQETIKRQIASQQRQQEALDTMKRVNLKAVFARDNAALKQSLAKDENGILLDDNKLAKVLRENPLKQKLDRNEAEVLRFDAFLNSGSVAAAVALPGELEACVVAMGQ